MLMDCSIATSMIILLYDEMGLAGGHWLNRNIMNSLGHACVQVGACILAGMSRSMRLRLPDADK